jgi:hypothetical protein
MCDYERLMKMIDDLDKQIEELEELRKKLVKELSKVIRLSLDKDMEELLTIIRNNPGIDNAKILKLVKLNTEQTYTNKMTALRRSRHLIVNKGTRTRPKWYTVD